MKNNKKLSQGMTLVEVIVAMTIFAIMAAAITTIIVFSNKTVNRSKMRDLELSTEKNIIGRKNLASDQLTEVHPNSYMGDYKIIFENAKLTGENPHVDNVKLYETHEGPFEEQFDFQLKTVVPSSSLNGLAISNLGDNEYCIHYINNLAEPIHVTMTITDGHFFEGSGQQYVHTTSTYTRTIMAGATADIGYFYNGTGSPNINFKITTSISTARSATGHIAIASFNSTKTINLTASQSGTNPFHVAFDFPSPTT